MSQENPTIKPLEKREILGMFSLLNVVGATVADFETELVSLEESRDAEGLDKFIERTRNYLETNLAILDSLDGQVKASYLIPSVLQARALRIANNALNNTLAAVLRRADRLSGDDEEVAPVKEVEGGKKEVFDRLGKISESYQPDKLKRALIGIDSNDKEALLKFSKILTATIEETRLLFFRAKVLVEKEGLSGHEKEIALAISTLLGKTQNSFEFILKEAEKMAGEIAVEADETDETVELPEAEVAARTNLRILDLAIADIDLDVLRSRFSNLNHFASSDSADMAQLRSDLIDAIASIEKPLNQILEAPYFNELESEQKDLVGIALNFLNMEDRGLRALLKQVEAAQAGSGESVSPKQGVIVKGKVSLENILKHASFFRKEAKTSRTLEKEVASFFAAGGLDIKEFKKVLAGKVKPLYRYAALIPLLAIIAENDPDFELTPESKESMTADLSAAADTIISSGGGDISKLLEWLRLQDYSQATDLISDNRVEATSVPAVEKESILQVEVDYVATDVAYHRGFNIEQGDEYFGNCFLGTYPDLAAGADPEQFMAMRVGLFDKVDTKYSYAYLVSPNISPEELAKIPPAAQTMTLEVGSTITVERGELTMDVEILEVEFDGSGKHITKLRTKLSAEQKGDPDGELKVGAPPAAEVVRESEISDKRLDGVMEKFFKNLKEADGRASNYTIGEVKLMIEPNARHNEMGRRRLGMLLPLLSVLIKADTSYSLTPEANAMMTEIHINWGAGASAEIDRLGGQSGLLVMWLKKQNLSAVPELVHTEVEIIDDGDEPEVKEKVSKPVPPPAPASEEVVAEKTTDMEEVLQKLSFG